LGWVSIFVVQIIAWKAAPEFSTGIARYHELELRDHWQANWVQFLPFILGATTVLSLLALGVRPMRSRRANDPKRVHLLILLGLTLVGYIVYWFQILGNTA
jgi:O-antigen/teichoic acid export membrane protein